MILSQQCTMAIKKARKILKSAGWWVAKETYHLNLSSDKTWDIIWITGQTYSRQSFRIEEVWRRRWNRLLCIKTLLQTYPHGQELFTLKNKVGTEKNSSKSMKNRLWKEIGLPEYKDSYLVSSGVWSDYQSVYNVVSNWVNYCLYFILIQFVHEEMVGMLKRKRYCLWHSFIDAWFILTWHSWDHRLFNMWYMLPASKECGATASAGSTIVRVYPASQEEEDKS